MIDAIVFVSLLVIVVYRISNLMDNYWLLTYCLVI